jgi:hypothetical protein
MKAAEATGSSGNSRKMNRTLPVSMYSDLQERIGALVEIGAMSAGHRGIFDNRDRCVFIAQDFVPQRTRFQELVFVDRLGPCGRSRCEPKRGRGQSGGFEKLSAGLCHEDRPVTIDVLHLLAPLLFHVPFQALKVNTAWQLWHQRGQIGRQSHSVVIAA